MTTLAMLKHRSAYGPLAMSGVALGIVLLALVVHGPLPTPQPGAQPDEGAAEGFRKGEAERA